ncbi:hypothetical protein D9M68_895280 [compost metagenome]
MLDGVVDPAHREVFDLRQYLMAGAELQHAGHVGRRAHGRTRQAALARDQIEHMHRNGAGHDADEVQAAITAQGGDQGIPVEVGAGRYQEEIQAAGNGFQCRTVGGGDHFVRAQALGFVLLAQ